MSTDGPPLAYAALRQRAFDLLAREPRVVEDALLAHVYGAPVPGPLRPRLVLPLAEDPRLTRDEEGYWSLGGAGRALSSPLDTLDLVALAVVPAGPRPTRDRLLALAAVQTRGPAVQAAFVALLNPGTRVPRYAAERAGVERSVFDHAPPFEQVAADLVAFLGNRPVVAREASLARAFLDAELHRVGWARPVAEWLDLSRLADALLDLPRKPTLHLITRACGLGSPVLRGPEDEARTVARVLDRLLVQARRRGLSTLGDLVQRGGIEPTREETRVLQQTRTAHAMPDAAGIYVLHGHADEPLYVGKARRLRERLGAYVSQSIGASRRMEGLVEAVGTVEARVCENDLEALVLEDREIRGTRPRFNTQLSLRESRVWLWLPVDSAASSRQRRLAPPRLQLKAARPSGGGDCLGPFRNAAVASWARDLARGVFELDRARRTLPSEEYRAQLARAWTFLLGDRALGIEAARAGMAAATAAGDYEAQRRWRALLRDARVYDLAGLVLPAEPGETRYAVLRPAGEQIEAFLLDRAVLVGYARVPAAEVAGLGQALLRSTSPRTPPEAVPVVRHWLGAQRPTARVVCLADDDDRAASVIDDAARSVAELISERARAARPLDPDA